MVSFDQIIFLSVLFSLYGISYLYKKYLLSFRFRKGQFRIPILENTPALHWLNFAFGSFLIAFVFGFNAYFQSLIQSVLVYLLMAFLPRKYKPQYFAFVGILGWTLIYHLYRTFSLQMDQYNTLDYASSQMLLTIKLTSIAFSYADRLNPDTPVKYWKENSLKNLPSISEYLGYIYFFPTLFTGPTLTLKLYQDFFSKCFNAPQDSNEFPLSTRICFRSSITRIIESIFWLLVHVFVQTLIVNSHFLRSSQFADYSFVGKVILLWLYTLTIKSKYYCVWKIGEANSIMTGIAYKSTNKLENGCTIINWDNGVNIYPSKVETAQSIKELHDYWNVCTSNWLKNCVYLRMKLELGFRNTVCIIITNLVSAFWHGFYMGYIITFISSGVATITNRYIRTIITPIIMKYSESYPYIKRAYDILAACLISILVGFVIIGFGLLDFYSTMKVYHQVYYYGWILLGLGILLTQVLKKFTKQKIN